MQHPPMRLTATPYRPQGKKLGGVDAVVSGRRLEVLGELGAQPGGGDGGSEGSSDGGDSKGSGGGGELEGLMRAAEQRQQQRGQEHGCSAEEAARGADAGAGSCAAPSSSSSTSGDGGLRITWLDESCEHLFRWKAPADGSNSSGGGSGGTSGTSSSPKKKKKKQKRLQHLLYCPTPRAVAERLGAAARRGMGAAVWELGQGVEETAALL